MNYVLAGFLTLFVVSVILRLGLTQLNIRNLRQHGHEVPQVFEGELDPATLAKMSDYTITHSRLGSLETFLHACLILIIILSGFIPWWLGVVQGLNLPFIFAGIIFLFGFSLLTGILDVPFDLYDKFVIERKFGFSTITLGLWITDLIKTLIISVILMALIIAVLLGLLQAAPHTWWLWMWIFYVGFQFLMMVLYPLLIAPLFNKFEPLDDPALVTGIQALMDKAGLKTSGLYKVDALKRSRHSNAYFTGIGKSKRIVLFDTLLAGHTTDEILAVLAHEIGHWKLGHIRRQMLVSIVVSLGIFFLTYKLLNWPALYQAFGVAQPVAYAGLLLLGIIARPFSLFFTPLVSGISRAYEYQADAFSRELVGNTEPLVAALKRLSRDNLSNLHPHPLYAWVYYSHPPLVARIGRLHTRT